jgi:phospholipid/cholesterol/gamma-HCH transport system substrate-binding protein
MKGQTLGPFIKLMVFAVVTILLTGVLALVISNQTFGSTRTFKADFPDATALLSGNDVRIDGVRVGTVGKVSTVRLRDGTPAAQVSFTVDKTVPVTSTTTVAIRYQNLIGQRYVAVEDSANAGTALRPGQVIGLGSNGSLDGQTTPALDLTALFNGFKPLFQALTPQDVNSFAMEVVNTLQGEGGTVDDLLAKSADLTNTVADRDAVIGQVINNLLSVLATVQKRDAGLSQTVLQLQRLVTGLAQDRNTIAASLSHIDDLASNSSELISQIRPVLPSDLKSLGQVANSIDTTKDCPGYFSRENDRNKTDVAAIPRFANNSCSGPNTVTGFLQREPTKLNSLVRTASYGAYFNFYLCDAQLGGAAGAQLPVEITNGKAAACSRPAVSQ